MKSIFFTNSYWSLPGLLKLSEVNGLGGLVILKESQPQLIELIRFAESVAVPVLLLEPNDSSQNLSDFVKAQDINKGYCLGFPKKLDASILDLFSDGVWNFHFGDLPRYAGPDPLFWVLKNGEKVVNLVCHSMDENWDSGYLIQNVSLPIYPGENYGLLGARLSQKVAEMILEFENKGVSGSKENAIPINSSSMKRPTVKELTIDWENQSSEKIEQLVNACNPVYGGAISQLGGGYVHILEVSPAMVRNGAVLSPGSVVHSTAEDGVFVLCSDYKYLKINIIKTPECVLSGNKLAALGLKKGAKLGKPSNSNTNSILIS